MMGQVDDRWTMERLPEDLIDHAFPLPATSERRRPCSVNLLFGHRIKHWRVIKLLGPTTILSSLQLHLCRYADSALGKDLGFYKVRSLTCPES